VPTFFWNFSAQYFLNLNALRGHLDFAGQGRQVWFGTSSRSGWVYSVVTTTRCGHPVRTSARKSCQRHIPTACVAHAGLCLQRMGYICMYVGVKVRATLLTTVTRKAIFMSKVSPETAGDIVGFVANDIGKVYDGMQVLKPLPWQACNLRHPPPPLCAWSLP
jgi:hypothetical protein